MTETRTVEVPVEVYKELPETLTQPLNYPDSVVFGVDGDITVNDLLAYAAERRTCSSVKLT
ncbi:MAG: hypothetical protein ACYTBS_07430 [Planctomycetota bacterium]